MALAAAEVNAALEQDYRPIRDYALIGDCHGAALVSREGSVDWCCLGRFDADPIFCRILDAKVGGFFSIRPIEPYALSRSYLPNTNILETRFASDSGTVILTDFMPVGRKPGSGTHNYVDLAAPHMVVRVVEAPQGSAELIIRFRPTVAFGRSRAKLRVDQGQIAVDDGAVLYHNLKGFLAVGDVAEARVKIEQGQRLLFVLAARPTLTQDPILSIDRYKSVTSAFWREWIAYCRYRGPFQDAVRRSLLAIKLLIYAPTGAIIAAPTTSLPEQIGGVRNWDYRYCWLRDSAFALYALAVTGYGGEARRFSAFLPRVCEKTAPDLKVVYGIEGEVDLAEQVITHLEGYRRSRPVRVGNAASVQIQLDVFGEILDWALLYKRLGGRFARESRAMLAALADFVAKHWREPDRGLWEMRGTPLRHTHGRIMSWVALDRALRLLGTKSDWVKAREEVANDINANAAPHLVQAHGRRDADAALLLAPFFGFRFDDSVIARTVQAVEEELRTGDFVYRYRTSDGVAGKEGAFLICSFWLVDALLYLGRRDEAAALFERLLRVAGDLGLYSEAVDPRDLTLLGNFPQAYTHLALIGSAVHLDLYDKGGSSALMGTYADRAQRAVSATLGWRGLWAAFKATWRVGRLFPSRASVLRPTI